MIGLLCHCSDSLVLRLFEQLLIRETSRSVETPVVHLFQTSRISTMQKKIIALALTGLVSGVAFAQTNVTIYGTLDMAYVQTLRLQDYLPGYR